MKKYYTVKEAANLLSVSTNTIYSYLDTGKLKARRIGKGRFKIPYSQLAPFIESDPVSGQISQTEFRAKENIRPIVNAASVPVVALNSSLVTPSAKSGITGPEIFLQPEQQVQVVSDNAGITPDIIADPAIPGIKTPPGYAISFANNDKFFWRLFKGLALLGLGIIYFFTGSFVFNFSGSFFEESSLLFNLILPFALVITGIVTLLDVFYEEKLQYYDTLVHIISALVTIYLSFVSLITGEYGRFVFACPLAILTVGHLVAGINRHRGTFFETFTKYITLLSVIGGIVVILYPDLFPVAALAQQIKVHRGVFGILWFGLLTLPGLYLLSGYGLKSKIFSVAFYLFSSVLTLIFATELSVEMKWDLAYLSYLLAVFGLFLAWWKNSKTVITQGKIYAPAFSFVWVSIAILIGLFIVSDYQQSLKSQKEQIVLANLDEVTQSIKNKIDDNASALTGFAGKPDMAEAIGKKDEEALILKAKEIFEKSDIARRILIYDSEGTAIGVYPRESLAQGTDFSSRDYFKETKSSLKDTVSDVLISINGVQVIMMTEPVFKDNAFYGMIGLAVDLEKLSLKVQKEAGGGNKIHVFTESGTYAFGSDMENVGRKKADLADLTPVLDYQNKSKEFNLYQAKLVNPEWSFVLQTPKSGLASDTAYINILFSVLVLVNSVFSLFAGMAISSRKKTEVMVVSTENQLLNPQVNLGGT